MEQVSFEMEIPSLLLKCCDADALPVSIQRVRSGIILMRWFPPHNRLTMPTENCSRRCAHRHRKFRRTKTAPDTPAIPSFSTESRSTEYRPPSLRHRYIRDSRSRAEASV